MNTTEDTNAARRGSGSNDLLGPLPPAMQDYPDHGELTWREEDMRAYAAQEVAAERERWASICRAVMAEHGGDPAGKLVSEDRERMQAQCQAAGASQVLAALRFNGGLSRCNDKRGNDGTQETGRAAAAGRN